MTSRPALLAAALLLAPHAAAGDPRPAVSWDTLAKVSVVRQHNRYVAQFPKEIVALDSKEVKLQGFMLPLDMGGKQKRFLLSAMPPSCPFCLPGGADQFVEVQAKRGVDYVTDPVVVSGRFALVHDDTGGLLYRLTDAVIVDR